MSLPRAEVISNAPVLSASASSAALAPARCAPMPATISGRRLLPRRATTASMDCARVAAGWAATDQRHAKLAGGVGIAFGHGDGVVLVPRAHEPDTQAVERHGKDCRVVAHEPEHSAYAQSVDVFGQRLEHRYDPTVVHHCPRVR